MPAPKGGTSGANSGANITGLKEFRAALKELEDPKYWGRQMAKTHKELARKVALWSSSEASGMGGMFAHFASDIRGHGTQTAARIQVSPQANAAFWGAKRQTGWHGGWRDGVQHERAQNGPGNNPAWVGKTWDVGVAGTGPYAINSTIARRSDDIVEEYADGIDELAKRAFPS